MAPAMCGGACLEFVGQLVVGGALNAHVLDHLAATLVGRQVLKQGGLAVERANARGTEQLVRREGIEVAAEAAHVYIEVLHRLGAVDQGQGALAMGRFDQFRNRIHGAERIAHVAEGHQLGSGAELGMEILQVDLPGWRHPAGGQCRRPCVGRAVAKARCWSDAPFP